MTTSVFINEVHYDNAGNDIGEFVEILAPLGEDLTGWSLVLYNGANGLPYNTLNLVDASRTDIGSISLYVFSLPSNGIQNGAPDGFALVDANGAVVQFLSYEGTMTALAGPASGLLSTDIGVSEDSATPVGFSLQLTGTGVAYDSFAWAAPATATPGALNTGQSVAPPAPVIVITEIMQNPAAVADSAGEWFEVHNPGTQDVDIDGWTISDNGSDSHVIANGGPLIVPAGGYIVLGNNANPATNGGVTVAYAYSGVFLANGDDELVLTRPDGGEADRVEWDGGPVWPDPNGASMALIDPALDNNVGTNWVTATTAYGAGDKGTPGAANDTLPPPPPPPVLTLISAIQGSSDFSALGRPAQVGLDDLSPLNGQTVTIEAIVTADMQDGANGPAGSDLNGFFVQEEDADADGNVFTSEGLFIFDGSNAAVDVAVGDKVRITGTVSDFGGMTQLGGGVTVEVLSSGNLLPTASVLDLGTTGAMLDAAGNWVVNLEAYEGMLVTFPEALTITEMFNLDRFGEYRVSDGRPQSFTQTDLPSVSGFAAHLEDVAARSLLLDDGLTTQNPSIIEVIDGNNGFLDASDSFRMGDTISNITGVLNYAFDEFRVQDPTGTYAQQNPRPDLPDVGGTLTVASFNVLNFFTTIDTSGTTTANGLDPRGADTVDEYNRQLEKLVTALADIDADVFGLIEIENDFLAGADGNAIETLVEALETRTGEDWAWVDPGQRFVGTDAIAVGFIHKASTVRLATGTTVATLTDADLAALGVDPGVPVFDGVSRVPVAASFEQIATGEVFTASINHFKSKGSPGSAGLLDADQLDGQGNANLSRLYAAQALEAWLKSDPTGSGDPDFLILGDLNAYAKEDPIRALEAAGYTNLAAQFEGEGAYGYVFDGQTGTLDYALANEPLLAQITGASEWRINADEADAIDYDNTFGGADPFDGTTPFRSSDHDPVIVGLDLRSDPVFNIVEGGPGNDRLFGTEMADKLIGGAGNNILVGGASGDIFLFDTTSNGKRENSQIRDYEANVDFIDLDGAAYTYRETANGVFLTVGDDRDMIVVRGVTDIDQIQFVDDLLVV